MAEVKPNGQSETALSALMRGYAYTHPGHLGPLFERLGASGRTLIQWGVDENRLSEGSLQYISEETGETPETLRRLNQITVQSTCELLPGDDPAEQDLHERFTAVVAKRDERAPAAAYVVFATADTIDRAALVRLLEENPGAVGHDTTVETLQFALDLPEGGILARRD